MSDLRNAIIVFYVCGILIKLVPFMVIHLTTIFDCQKLHRAMNTYDVDSDSVK